jgi:hypothetical protein
VSGANDSFWYCGTRVLPLSAAQAVDWVALGRPVLLGTYAEAEAAVVGPPAWWHYRYRGFAAWCRCDPGLAAALCGVGPDVVEVRLMAAGEAAADAAPEYP